MTTPRPAGRIHVIGAGPVGLILTALLQDVGGQQVRLYERRSEYTRTRMVALSSYLVADSIDSYKVDEIDGQDVEAIFEPAELETRLAYRRSVATDLRAVPAVDPRLHADPDDQAQQGPARVRRGHLRAVGEAARLLGRRSVSA